MPRAAQPLRLVLLAALAPAACFTDNAPSTSNVLGGGGDTSGSSGAPDDTTGVASTTSTATTGDVLLSSEGGLESSSAADMTTSQTSFAEPDQPVSPHDQCVAGTTTLGCGTCLCDQCLDAYTACSKDPGCAAIRTCAFAEGCNDDACFAPCEEVIDMYGGPAGESAQMALKLSNCFHESCSC